MVALVSEVRTAMFGDQALQREIGRQVVSVCTVSTHLPISLFSIKEARGTND